jgi:hypothetical protein
MTDLVRVTDTDRLLQAIKPSYESEARRFLEFAGDREISLETYQAYIHELEEEGKSVFAVNKHIVTCRALICRLFDSPDITEVQKRRLEQSTKEAYRLGRWQPGRSMLIRSQRLKM